MKKEAVSRGTTYKSQGMVGVVKVDLPSNFNTMKDVHIHSDQRGSLDSDTKQSFHFSSELRKIMEHKH